MPKKTGLAKAVVRAAKKEKSAQKTACKETKRACKDEEDEDLEGILDQVPFHLSGPSRLFGLTNVVIVDETRMGRGP